MNASALLQAAGVATFTLALYQASKAVMLPAADISQLLSEGSDAIGLAVPSMRYGSPGMGDQDAREAYDVFVIKCDGTTEVFTAYSEA